MHAHHGLFATFGASSGFSGAALWAWARSPSTAGAVVFAGSVASTIFAWFLARREQAARAALEIDRLKREAEREQRIADAIAAIQIAQLQATTTHPRGTERHD